MKKMFGFGFVITGAPDWWDMEWVEVAESDVDKKHFIYKCRGVYGDKKTEILFSDAESIPLETCEGLFVGEIEFLN